MIPYLHVIVHARNDDSDMRLQPHDKRVSYGLFGTNYLYICIVQLRLGRCHCQIMNELHFKARELFVVVLAFHILVM